MQRSVATERLRKGEIWPMLEQNLESLNASILALTQCEDMQRLPTVAGREHDARRLVLEDHCHELARAISDGVVKWREPLFLRIVSFQVRTRLQEQTAELCGVFDDVRPEAQVVQHCHSLLGSHFHLVGVHVPAVSVLIYCVHVATAGEESADGVHRSGHAVLEDISVVHRRTVFQGRLLQMQGCLCCWWLWRTVGVEPGSSSKLRLEFTLGHGARLCVDLAVRGGFASIAQLVILRCSRRVQRCLEGGPLEARKVGHAPVSRELPAQREGSFP
mmetsp:Transcript_5249/g.13827  ORF Transcript_5249/g.13827 Transcript_5249/m.13827 type:complete len:274 (-) Transcript_5249:1120-1941(-)